MGQSESNEHFCDSDKFELRPYQKYCIKTIKKKNLLVYHKLGSGKSITFVMSANELHIDTVFMSPASLQQNMVSYLRKFKVGDYIIYNMPYNSPALLAHYQNIGNFDNKFIVIDEAHLFFQNVISKSSKNSKFIFDKLLHAKGSRIMLLTGTPIIGDPYELCPMFALLTGTFTFDKVKNTTDDVRKMSMREFRDTFITGTTGKDYTNNFSKMKPMMINKDKFRKFIKGYTSYYPGIKDPYQYVVPYVEKTEYVYCSMGEYQWQSYKISRDLERNQHTDNNLFSDLIAFRLGSLSASNFAFPSDITGSAETKWEKLLERMTLKQIYENLPKFSIKLMELFDRLTNQRTFIYSRFRTLGGSIISAMLQQKGWKLYNDEGASDEGATFALIDGTTKNTEELIAAFNVGKFNLLIGTSVISAGVSLLNVRVIHIFDAQWRTNQTKQIIGRAVRLCSHSTLPREERNVKVYQYLSVTPKTYKGEKYSSEIVVEGSAKKRNELIEQFLDVVKKS